MTLAQDVIQVDDLFEEGYDFIYLKFGGMIKVPKGSIEAIETGSFITMDQIDEITSQWVVNQDVTEGASITLPDTNKDITLNLLTGGVSLTQVSITLPSNTDGRIGQRVFVNSNGQIDEVDFSAGSNTVNSSAVMFTPGDNFVYYRNQTNIWSRITS